MISPTLNSASQEIFYPAGRPEDEPSDENDADSPPRRRLTPPRVGTSMHRVDASRPLELKWRDLTHLTAEQLYQSKQSTCEQAATCGGWTFTAFGVVLCCASYFCNPVPVPFLDPNFCIGGTALTGSGATAVLSSKYVAKHITEPADREEAQRIFNQIQEVVTNGRAQGDMPVTGDFLVNIFSHLRFNEMSKMSREQMNFVFEANRDLFVCVMQHPHSPFTRQQHEYWEDELERRIPEIVII